MAARRPAGGGPTSPTPGVPSSTTTLVRTTSACVWVVEAAAGHDWQTVGVSLCGFVRARASESARSGVAGPLPGTIVVFVMAWCWRSGWLHRMAPSRGDSRVYIYATTATTATLGCAAAARRFGSCWLARASSTRAMAAGRQRMSAVCGAATALGPHPPSWCGRHATQLVPLTRRQF